jgi:hypothetical protein
VFGRLRRLDNRPQSRCTHRRVRTYCRRGRWYSASRLARKSWVGTRWTTLRADNKQCYYDLPSNAIQPVEKLHTVCTWTYWHIVVCTIVAVHLSRLESYPLCTVIKSMPGHCSNTCGCSPSQVAGCSQGLRGCLQIVPMVLTGFPGHTGDTPSHWASSAHSASALRHEVPDARILPYGQHPVPGVQSCCASTHGASQHSSELPQIWQVQHTCRNPY